MLMEELKAWLSHPKELFNILRFMVGEVKKTVLRKIKQRSHSKNLQICYKYLKETSRSFASRIHMLEELSDLACVYYLVLRVLDTVEDDLTLSPETKKTLLLNVHNYLYQPDWKFMGSKHKHKQVLEDFPAISLAFRNLEKVYQDLIMENCQEMGEGMVELLENKMNSLQDLDKYCHAIGGSMGIACSKVAVLSKLEGPLDEHLLEIADSVGIFLAKSTIVRDYFEDLHDEKEYWPREVWSKYVKNYSDLAKPENINKAVPCLNELLTNTLQHVPDVLKYLAWLKNPTVFQACAVPFMVKIMTMAACYNNNKVFKGKVAIRKGQIATLMMEAINMDVVNILVYQSMEEIYQKIPSTDPSASKTREIVSSIQSLTKPRDAVVAWTHYLPSYASFLILLAASCWQYLWALIHGSEETT